MTVLAWLLIVLAAAPVLTAYFLRRGQHLERDILVLNERAGLALRDALVAVLAAFLSVVYLVRWDLPSGLGLGVLGLVLVLNALPSVVWLWLYWGGHWGDPA